MYMLKRSLLFIIGNSQAAFVLPVHMNCELNPAVKPLETTRGLIICWLSLDTHRKPHPCKDKWSLCVITVNLTKTSMVKYHFNTWKYQIVCATIWKGSENIVCHSRRCKFSTLFSSSSLPEYCKLCNGVFYLNNYKVNI